MIDLQIIYNKYLQREIIEFLLSQEGINDVKITKENYMDCITISGTLMPSIVAKFIDLFEENKYSTMFAFNKEKNINTKKITYHVDDMCCEYCHMGFIRKLFDNDNIVSVESNFSLDKPAFDIEYVICYDDTVGEKEIFDYIQNSL